MSSSPRDREHVSADAAFEVARREAPIRLLRPWIWVGALALVGSVALEEQRGFTPIDNARGYPIQGTSWSGLPVLVTEMAPHFAGLLVAIVPFVRRFAMTGVMALAVYLLAWVGAATVLVYWVFDLPGVALWPVWIAVWGVMVCTLAAALARWARKYRGERLELRLSLALAGLTLLHMWVASLSSIYEDRLYLGLGAALSHAGSIALVLPLWLQWRLDRRP